MSRYDELRRYRTLPQEQRMAMLRNEMLPISEHAAAMGRDLVGAGNMRTQLALSPRSGELAEIIAEAASDLEQSVAALPGDGRIADEERLRLIRHDLRGKLSTVLGASALLESMLVQDGAGEALLAAANALNAAAAEMLAVLQALTDERGRGSST